MEKVFRLIRRLLLWSRSNAPQRLLISIINVLVSSIVARGMVGEVRICQVRGKNEEIANGDQNVASEV